MSAWVVSKKHIDLMVAGVVYGTRDGVIKPRRRSADRLGQMLVDECVASVHYCYPSDDVSKGELPGPVDPYYLKPYRFEDPDYRPTAAELWKACSCYSYQSCEHPGWKASAAKRLCDRIETEVCAAVPNARRFRDTCDRGNYNAIERWAEYESAPWGFDALEIAVCRAKADPVGKCLVAGVQAGDNPGPLNDWMLERGLIADPLDARDVRMLVSH